VRHKCIITWSGIPVINRIGPRVWCLQVQSAELQHGATSYKPEGQGSKPDEVNEFFEFT
jgi:hypothetical protein